MLLFTDSFDHYTTLSQKWTTVYSNYGTASISATAARNGAKGLLISAGDCAVVKSWGSNIATVIVGFAMANSTSAANTSFCILLDGSTPQIQLAIDSAGVIRAYRGGTNYPNSQLASVTLLGTATAVSNPSAFHYYELKVTIDPTAGSLQLKVDGTTVLNLSGINTRGTSNTFTNALLLGNDSYNNSAAFWFDDVVIMDTTGSFNNNFLGDVKVVSQLPTGNGTTNNFTIGGTTPAATHYQSVNENPPDDNVTYVSDGTVGDIDRFTFPAITATSVLAVAINLRVTKDDATVRSVRGAIKSSSTVGDTGTDLSVPQTTYADLQAISETDPNTSAAWTATAVNSAEFGIKVTV